MSGKFQPLTSARVLRKIKQINCPKEGASYVINRNPRNLEKLRIGYKPDGYHLDKPGRSFWHKLELNVTGRYLTADVNHFQNGTVISASTQEWAIKKHLFKTNDTVAYVNLAHILALRCVQSGIIEIMCDIKSVPGGKIDKFIKTISENGISLKEPERCKAAAPWDVDRPEKPWEVTEPSLS